MYLLQQLLRAYKYAQNSEKKCFIIELAKKYLTVENFTEFKNQAHVI